jgi:hypothetical protein
MSTNIFRRSIVGVEAPIDVLILSNHFIRFPYLEIMKVYYSLLAICATVGTYYNSTRLAIRCLH